MDRREFIKHVLRVAGVAGLIRMGLLEEAQARGIFPAALNTAGTGTIAGGWVDWDESAEAGIASSDIYVAFMESGLGLDETGQGGGLAGADLVLEDVDNTILAAAGTPPSRAMSNDAFVGTTDALPHLVRDSSTGWTIIFKFNPTIGAAMRLLQWATNNFGGINQVQAQIDNAGNLYVYVCGGTSGVVMNWHPAANLNTGQITWVVIQCNGVETKSGYRQVVRPASWADMTEASAGGATAFDAASELDWVGHSTCGLYGRNDLVSPFVGDAYYFLVAKKALLS